MRTTFTIVKGVDAHVHLREGDVAADVIDYTAEQWQAAVVMPNKPEILTVERLIFYRDFLRGLSGPRFTPLMTFKLTENTSLAEIVKLKAAGALAAKLYPEGVTTGSAGGVSDFLSRKMMERYAALADNGLFLCIHGEMPKELTRYAEQRFLPVVEVIADRFSNLKITLEHISTAEAADFVATVPNVACTITPHHLLMDEDWILAFYDSVAGHRGLAPHNFCYPRPKLPEDRAALISLATSGVDFVMGGTDSAPWLKHKKEASCGCAGVFCAPVAMSVYTSVFHKHGDPHDWVRDLERFTSGNAAKWYGLTLSGDRIKMAFEKWVVPYRTGGSLYTPTVEFWLAGKELSWKVVES